MYKCVRKYKFSLILLHSYSNGTIIRHNGIQINPRTEGFIFKLNKTFWNDSGIVAGAVARTIRYTRYTHGLCGAARSEWCSLSSKRAAAAWSRRRAAAMRRSHVRSSSARSAPLDAHKHCTHHIISPQFLTEEPFSDKTIKTLLMNEHWCKTFQKISKSKSSLSFTVLLRSQLKTSKSFGISPDRGLHA